jgi:beta-glucosidase
MKGCLMSTDLYFPPSFLWGAATASYQIEGAGHEDGRGESIWDRFCATPGKVRNGENGSIACDHYHRYREDVHLMHELGLQAYRFSTAWPRILPEGRGRVNPKGLDFYDRLVDELLTYDIEPYLTLYHWDLPQVLEDRGGWTSRGTVEAFLEYTEAVVRRLGDRVHNWITHNEPWVIAWQGYGWGEHAPGRTGDDLALTVVHNVLLSHGLAVPLIRRDAPQARVGITLNLTPVYPASNDPDDVAAARMADVFANTWFLDPVFRGAYPAEGQELFREHLPDIQPGDLPSIAVPIDFLGINTYSRHVVSAHPETKKPLHLRPSGAEFTDMDWEVYPDGLHDLLVRVHRDYSPKSIYVTENGAAYTDVRLHDGSVQDPERQRYLEGHLGAASRAIRAGVPLHGYFVWSLLDNFEWALGYGRRFGIIHVDYPTQERTPKGSAYWYRDLIAHTTSAATRTA